MYSKALMKDCRVERDVRMHSGNAREDVLVAETAWTAMHC